MVAVSIMNILTTIIPIFAIIVLGWLARVYGFIRSEFIEPANRLVFYLALPAMVFRAISRASLSTQFDMSVVALTLLSVCIVFGIALLLVRRNHLPRSQRGTFIQTSFHGNLGYIGLAVVFYYLGNEGLVRASIIMGFLMILQNLLAVIALQMHSPRNPTSTKRWVSALKIMHNPIILSALAGLLVSLTALPVPLVLGRCLDILRDLALPMALLIIGASLSFEMLRSKLKVVLACGLLKLILLPGIGFILYRLFNVLPDAYLPGIILLASPTATVTYVMAGEMQGDSELAVAAISLNTLLSAVTYSVWLGIVG